MKYRTVYLWHASWDINNDWKTECLGYFRKGSSNSKIYLVVDRLSKLANLDISIDYLEYSDVMLPIKYQGMFDLIPISLKPTLDECAVVIDRIHQHQRAHRL